MFSTSERARLPREPLFCLKLDCRNFIISQGKLNSPAEFKFEGKVKKFEFEF
jgi:hypothetical protein